MLSLDQAQGQLDLLFNGEPKAGNLWELITAFNVTNTAAQQTAARHQLRL